jgi:ACS family hexuronate transporter-like MFS transporter
MKTEIRHLRWYIASLLFIITTINYVDRQVLSVAIPVIRDQFRFSQRDYSHIVSAFLFSYTIMQAASGRVIDKLGTRIGLTIFVCWWSLAEMLHTFAGSVWTFGFYRFLLGIGEAGNWPAAVKAVAEWFPTKERALAVAYFNSGSSVGAIIAPPLIAWTIVRFSWRMAFLAAGVAGLVWLLAWRILYSTLPENPSIGITALEKMPAKRSPVEFPWVRLFRYRELWGLVLGRLLCDPVWWFYVFWLPEYLKTQRSFSMAMIGAFAWIPFLSAAVGGILAGCLSNYLINRGVTVEMARKLPLIVSAVLLIAGVPAAFTPSAFYSIVFISIATFSYASWATVFIALATDMFGSELMASVYGITGTAAGVGGIVFTLVTGYTVEKFTYVPIFVTAGLLPILGTALVLALVGTAKPIIALQGGKA